MNLIEQLGGERMKIETIEQYKETKIILAKRKLHLDRGTYLGSQVEKVREVISHLEAEILRYRREHNIFEVEDDVVILTLALGSKYSWKVESFDGCMIELSQVGQPNEWVHIAEITHATPEEIQAGRRL